MSTCKKQNAKEMSNFFLKIYLRGYGLKFFIIGHISNHINKYNQYFTFLNWTVIINNSINIIHVTWIFNKSFWISEIFHTFFTFVNLQLIVWFKLMFSDWKINYQHLMDSWSSLVWQLLYQSLNHQWWKFSIDGQECFIDLNLVFRKFHLWLNHFLISYMPD